MALDFALRGGPAQGHSADFGDATGWLLVGQHNKRRYEADRYDSAGEKQNIAQPKYRLRPFLAIHAYARVGKTAITPLFRSLVHLL